MIEPICKIRVLSDNGVTSRSKLDEESARVNHYAKGKDLFGYSIKESDDGSQYIRISDINAKPEWIKCWDPDGQNPRVSIASLELAATSQLDKLVHLLVASLNDSGQASSKRATGPLMLDPNDKLFANLDAINTQLLELFRKLDVVSNVQANDHALLMDHDKILIRGTETTPSIQETIRGISAEQREFVAEIRKEREEAKKRKEDDEKSAKAEVTKWKWTLIGFAFTMIPKIFSDAVNFWTTVVKPALHIP